MANGAAEGGGWTRGMFRKHQDGSRASLSRGLAAMHVILLSTGGARGVRLSHSSAPQRGRGTRRLACLSLGDAPGTFPSPQLACASSSKHFALPPVSDNTRQHRTTTTTDGPRRTDRSLDIAQHHARANTNNRARLAACLWSLDSGITTGREAVP